MVEDASQFNGSSWPPPLKKHMSDFPKNEQMLPSCFTRNAIFGRYNATRQAWKQAYRNARLHADAGEEMDLTIGGIAWKARLIVRYERASLDALTLEALADD